LLEYTALAAAEVVEDAAAVMAAVGSIEFELHLDLRRLRRLGV
jgi:hypothetical protein